jgi:hypothetical protein
VYCGHDFLITNGVILWRHNRNSLFLHYIAQNTSFIYVFLHHSVLSEKRDIGEAETHHNDISHFALELIVELAPEYIRRMNNCVFD